MDEFMEAVAQSLRNAGFDCSYAPGELRVAGVSFDVEPAWRQRGHWWLLYERYGPRRGSVAQAVTSVLRALPGKLQRKDRESALEAANAFVERVWSDRKLSEHVEVRILPDGRVAVTFASDDFSRVAVAADALLEFDS